MRVRSALATSLSRTAKRGHARDRDKDVFHRWRLCTFWCKNEPPDEGISRDCETEDNEKPAVEGGNMVEHAKDEIFQACWGRWVGVGGV